MQTYEPVYQSETIKPLICCLSPRDIDIVKEGHETLKDAPHLWIKYFPAKDAYFILRDYFLKHIEYTHLMLCPDDLVVNSTHYNQLVKDLEQYDYPVLGGVCNKSMVSGHSKYFNICINELPNIDRKKGRRYVWAVADETPRGIIQVKFAGNPFTFIRRDVVEQIEFISDVKYNPFRRLQEHKVFDLTFCYHCSLLGIPIHVDTNVRMLHLLGAPLSQPYGNQVERLLVGKKPAKVYFQKGNRTKDITREYKTLVPITKKR